MSEMPAAVSGLVSSFMDAMEESGAGENDVKDALNVIVALFLTKGVNSPDIATSLGYAEQVHKEISAMIVANWPQPGAAG